MREPNLPLPERELRSLLAALAVVITVLPTAVLVGEVAGWRGVAALPLVLVAVSVLVRAVVGDHAEPRPPAGPGV
jgi:hypothetical protein